INYLKTEEILKENNAKYRKLKELYENIINSTENLMFVKDTNFSYIACNHAFEKFVGKSRDEIIGKYDYDVFSKEVADSFSKHVEEMLKTNKSKTNFEWVTYPNGEKIYLVTIKSPLVDSKGNIFGLVGNSINMTKQKKVEKELSVSNDKFEKAFNNTPNIIIISNLKTGKIYDVNKTFTNLIGYKKDEVIGKTTFEIDLWHDFEDRNKYLETFNKFGSIDGDIYKINTKHKNIIIGKVHASLITISGEEYILAVAEDITEKQKNLKLLEEKKRELETIIQEAPNPIMLHNENGKVLLVNKVWEELTGYKYEEIDTIAKWTKKAYGEKMLVAKERMDILYPIHGKVDEGEYNIITKDGETIIWQFSSAPLGIIDGVRTVISSGMDITELKHKDDLIMMQSRHAAMGEMIGMIAHQWRQPISVIAMVANNVLLDIALDSFDATQAEKFAQTILNQTSHLSKTIDDFRNFFKPDKEVSKVKLQDIIEETITIVNNSLIHNNITLKTSFKSNSEVDAYPRELMQVFVNIINNAKDAITSNSIEKPIIQIKVYDDDKYVNTEICDNGKGIDAAVLPKIFDPYYTTKDEKTGTGLGLYMSKMIIENHLNGVIEAKNDEQGACLRVRLLK
nr:PAS domain-containing sensor histidine kinase [Sulfurimonas sp.]